MGSRKETGRFLDSYDILRLNQEDTDHLNRPTSSSEMETVIRNLPSSRAGPDGFTAKFYKSSREEEAPIQVISERLNMMEFCQTLFMRPALL